jgi:hypothetical protein
MYIHITWYSDRRMVRSDHSGQVCATASIDAMSVARDGGLDRESASRPSLLDLRFVIPADVLIEHCSQRHLTI